jgi:hypothetical protein
MYGFKTKVKYEKDEIKDAEDYGASVNRFAGGPTSKLGVGYKF